MPEFKFNIYFFIITFVSLVALLMAGLMLLLLPGSGEIIRIMQWRMVRAKSFHIDASIRYGGWHEYRDENFTLQKDREEVLLETRGWVDRTVVEDLEGGFSQEFTVAVGTEPDKTVVDGDFRRFGDADFLRFSSLPERLGALDLREYRDQWLRFSLEDIRENLDVPLFGPVVGFIGGGGGWYSLRFLEAEDDFHSEEDKLDSDTALGGYAQLGFDFPITDHVSLRVEDKVHFVRFHDLSRFTPGNDSIGGPIHSFQFGVGVRF